MGTPCNSWSMARRGPKGAAGPPGPLRDKNYLLGLPDLNDRDQHRVDMGNNLMKFSASVFSLCRNLGVAVALENPHTSMIWQAEPMKQLAAHPRVHSEYSDFCMEGVAWRKRTRFLFFGADLGPACKHCSSKGGVCDRSGKRHHILEGKCGTKFWTAIAEPYPATLCYRLVTCFSNLIASRTVSKLESLFA